jgi:hypothetical protein
MLFLQACGWKFVEAPMNLNVPQFDGRKWGYKDVSDEDTGKVVGYIRCDGTGFAGSGGIEISLFDGKYRTVASSRPECCGFVRGVESVLNRMTSADDGRAELENELDELRRAQRQTA